MSHSKIGRLIIVVGASGAGKDTVLKSAQKHFEGNPRVAFVRRVITRECNPKAEVHDSVSEQQFLEQQARGDFCVSWQANDLYYGLPASVHSGIAQGQLMVANGSRAAIDDIRSKFSELTTVHIVTSMDVLAMRLERRSRESAAEIKNRLERNNTIAELSGNDVVTIDNSGERQTAIDEFIDLLDSY